MRSGCFRRPGRNDGIVPGRHAPLREPPWPSGVRKAGIHRRAGAGVRRRGAPADAGTELAATSTGHLTSARAPRRGQRLRSPSQPVLQLGGTPVPDRHHRGASGRAPARPRADPDPTRGASPRSPFELRVHFAVVLNKILFRLDHVVLHAAAVQVHDRGSPVCGRERRRQEHICLGLARQGARCWERTRDPSAIRSPGFLVSGGDERSRLTERDRATLLPRAAGGSRPRLCRNTEEGNPHGRLLLLSAPFRGLPGPSAPVSRGQRPLRSPAAEGATRVAPPDEIHRASSSGLPARRDQARFLDLLAGFIATVDSFEVELSHDLS